MILTYLLVALLHGLWDGLPRIEFLVLPLGIRVSVASVVINLLGIGVLIGLWHQALRRATQQPVAAPTGVQPTPSNWPADSRVGR